MNQPLQVIRSQIKAAKSELDAYAPAECGWYGRCLKTADAVVPWLTKIAPEVCDFCEDVFNSPNTLRDLWLQLNKGNKFGVLGEQIDLHLSREQVLVKEIAGDVVSRILTDYLLGDGFGKRLRANGRSDYPDLYLPENDYSKLPRHTRKHKVYGAARKGKTEKPVRIPDGIEIKTCKNSFHVDCHYYHIGLHVALFYKQKNRQAKMCDLMAGFLRKCDYKIAARNTDATTAKASFGPRQFVSLLPGGSEPGRVKGLGNDPSDSD